MSIQTQISEILNKKMDRQGFLKHLVIGVVAISGVGTALRLLSPAAKQKNESIGYGGSVYGGSKDVS